MLRCLLAALFLLATPVLAQTHGPQRATHCVQAAMVSLLTLGAAPEQLATVALARCYDEIEAALANVTAEAARIALRRELFDFAVQVAGVAVYTEASSATRDAVERSF
jgi:hypothetical protein